MAPGTAPSGVQRAKATAQFAWYLKYYWYNWYSYSMKKFWFEFSEFLVTNETASSRINGKEDNLARSIHVFGSFLPEIS